MFLTTHPFYWFLGSDLYDLNLNFVVSYSFYDVLDGLPSMSNECIFTYFYILSRSHV